MTTLTDLERMLAEEHHLAVVSTARLDGSVLSSVVNCGVMPHPVSGEPCVALVSSGSAARNRHLRRGAPLTVVVRRGWQWAGATGRATLIGPDDPVEGFDAERVRLLLRSVFQAAGGTHDDFDEYDRVMLDDRRVGVFVVPDRFSGVV